MIVSTQVEPLDSQYWMTRIQTTSQKEAMDIADQHRPVNLVGYADIIDERDSLRHKLNQIKDLLS